MEDKEEKTVLISGIVQFKTNSMLRLCKDNGKKCTIVLKSKNLNIGLGDEIAVAAIHLSPRKLIASNVKVLTKQLTLKI